MEYDYRRCTEDIINLSGRFPFIESSVIGTSVMKKPIYCIRIGSGRRKLFINCAHHGLEYLTSAFAIRFLHEYAAAVEDNTEFFGINPAEVLRHVSVFAVPMVNPDGVDIAVNGLDITNSYHQKLISDVGIHSFNRVWQANASGVDINHNYNAGWRVVKSTPSPTRFSGPYSESEPETKAMVEFMKKMKFDLLIAFHSQGGEIYYDFDGMQAENSKKIADKMAAESGYAVSVPTGSASFGGCKDWFIKEFGKAGFTIEMGHGKNPLPMDMLDEIFDENARIITAAIAELMPESAHTEVSEERLPGHSS